MLSNKYLQLWVDISWLLSRNVFAISAGKHAGEYTAGEVLRLTVQSLAKLGNQLGLTADKILLLNDRWSKEYGGYYRTHLLGGKYKDDRVYVDSLYVEKLRDAATTDSTITPEQIQKAEDEAFSNQVRMEAKYAIMNELHHFGMASIWYEGLEFDDLAVIASMMYSSSADPKTSKKICIYTKDSDMFKAITPLVDLYKAPKKGDQPHIWTYEEAYQQVPQELRDKGLSLYWYHCMMEALGAGHNNARSPRKKGSNVLKVMCEVMDGNYENIEDKELFDTTMKSFDFSTYPMFQDVQDLIRDKFMTTGRVGTLTEFRNFCIKHNVEGISDSYFSNFVSRLDRSLYLDPAPVQKYI